MRRLVAIPLSRSESFWNGIDPKLGILVYDADDESDVDDRILDPLRELAKSSGGFALVASELSSQTLQEEASILRADESLVTHSLHLHRLRSIPHLDDLARLQSEGLFVLRCPSLGLQEIGREIEAQIARGFNLTTRTERGAIVNLSRRWGPVVSLLDSASSVAYYGPPADMVSLSAQLEALVR